MKPFFDQDGITLYCGDLRDVLPRLDPGTFDLALADPTYGETTLSWDRRVAGWPALVRPLLAPHGSLWCWGSMRSHQETASDFDGWHLAQDVVWEKHNGSGFAADRFKRVHEIACHYYPADARWAEVFKRPVKTAGERRPAAAIKSRLAIQHTGAIGPRDYQYTDERMARSVIYARSCHGYADNETQKPEAVVRPLAEYSCPPGGRVLSVFTGSGTDLAVARSLGLRAVGVELREEQCEAAVRRLSQAVLPLGAA